MTDSIAHLAHNYPAQAGAYEVMAELISESVLRGNYAYAKVQAERILRLIRELQEAERRTDEPQPTTEAP